MFEGGSMHCSNCGEPLSETANTCSKCGTRVALPSLANADSLGSAQAGEARSPALKKQAYVRLPPTAWLSCMLYVSIIADLAAIISGLMQFHLLSDFKAGVYSVKSVIIEVATANDERQHWIAILKIIVYLVTAIFFAVWTYRANKKARDLGARGMDFTPGWSVGYYFIPFANLWMPYLVMKEIWCVSKAPAAWQKIRRGALLPWWWAFWLITNLVGWVVFQIGLDAKSLDALLLVTSLQIAMYALDVVTVVFAVVIVKHIGRMQQGHDRDPEFAAVNPSVVAQGVGD